MVTSYALLLILYSTPQLYTIIAFPITDGLHATFPLCDMNLAQGMT